VRAYRKLTLITAILGLVILVPIIVGYAYVNSLIGLEVTDPTLQASNGHQEKKVLLISYYQNFYVTGLEEYEPL
jgi:hypothetical protein